MMKLYRYLSIIVIGICLLNACSDEADTPVSGTPHTAPPMDEIASVNGEKPVSSPGENYHLDTLWEITGLRNPESVIYDEKQQRLFITNVDGSPVEKDGYGSVSIASTDGKLLDYDWITGMDSPKGITIHNDHLYVADIDRLHEINIERREIVNTYRAEGAEFLNDVTVSPDGIVYVSDMMLNRIYALRNGTLELWLESQDLEFPNGLHAESDRIIVGAWGVMTDGFNTEVPGHLKAVNIASKTVSSLGNGNPVGNLDGIEQLDDHHYLVTDWMAGKILVVDHKGNISLVKSLEQGSADHEYNASRNLVLIPMMNSNRLVAYKISKQ